MNKDTIDIIQEKLDYRFNDTSYLERAFTHSSVSTSGLRNYELLEFLGDSILDFVVAKFLLDLYPSAREGELTRRRAELVSQQPLEVALRGLDVAKYLVVGHGENLEAIINGTKVMSNLYEAIVGAIYLDSDSLEVTKKFVVRTLLNNPDLGDIPERDFKSELNDLATGHHIAVSYKLVEQGGPQHDPTFTVDVFLDGFFSGRGKGRSKKAAEQDAAHIALNHINR